MIAILTTNAATFEPLRLQSTPIITFGYVMQVIFSLVLVLGLIYLTSRYILPRFQINPKSRNIEVVERVGLEPQVTLYLVKANGKTYFLAAGNRSVVKLDEYNEKAN